MVGMAGVGRLCFLVNVFLLLTSLFSYLSRGSRREGRRTERIRISFSARMKRMPRNLGS